MNRPTVFNLAEAADVQNDLDRAIDALLALRAAYDETSVFVYQTTEGERFASKDLLEASRIASEACDQMQIALLSRIASHIGEPTQTFAIKDILGGNTTLEDIRTEYAEQIEGMAPHVSDYRPAHTDHLRVVNGGLV